MRLSFLSSQVSPIAIDFGSSSVKLLQTSTDGQPRVVAIDEFEIPESARLQTDRRMAFIAEELPKAIKRGGFRTRRVICSPPSSQTLIMHMQVPPGEGSAREDAIKQQLQSRYGCIPSAVVARWVDVTGVQRQGQDEVICFAAAREEIMRLIELLKKCRLEVAGVHSEPQAIIWSFHHLHRRAEDAATTTMYVDLGWGNTKVAIGHGHDLVFAKCIQLGGRHMDQAVASRLKCDAATAHAYRMSVAASEPNAPPLEDPPAESAHEAPAILRAALAKGGAAVATERRGAKIAAALRQPVTPATIPGTNESVDLTEQLDAIADELLMCARYHASLFPGRAIDRIIFLGGESRHVALCQHIARALRLPAQLGDPLARLMRGESPRLPDMTTGRCQPGWAVVTGLCTEAIEA